jgi:uncharacterized membrane protein YczE
MPTYCRAHAYILGLLVGIGTTVFSLLVGVEMRVAPLWLGQLAGQC